MFHYYKLLLIVGAFGLSLAILSVGGRATDTSKSNVRILFSALAIWAYVVACRLIVDAVDVSLAANATEVEEIFRADGAKNVGALVFGWIPGGIVTFTSWFAICVWHWLKDTLRSTTAASGE